MPPAIPLEHLISCCLSPPHATGQVPGKAAFLLFLDRVRSAPGKASARAAGGNSSAFPPSRLISDLIRFRLFHRLGLRRQRRQCGLRGLRGLGFGNGCQLICIPPFSVTGFSAYRVEFRCRSCVSPLKRLQLVTNNRLPRHALRRCRALSKVSRREPHGPLSQRQKPTEPKFRLKTID